MLISIIVPILNEAQLIPAVLARLSEQPGEFEIILVDGRSRDRGSGLLTEQVKVISKAGAARGSLLNLGAEAASGEVLLFLWPESQLPPEALLAIEHNLKMLPQAIGGNFHLKFDKGTFFTRLLIRFFKQRRYHGYYYGNSGIFIRKELFQAMGGFQPYTVLEDGDLARRMEGYGPTLYLSEAIVAPSPTFRGQKLKVLLTWLIIHGLFMLGIQPNRLARLYRPTILILPA